MERFLLLAIQPVIGPQRKISLSELQRLIEVSKVILVANK